MSNEENIKSEISKQFPETEGKIFIKRARRIDLEIEYPNFEKTLIFIRHNLNFNILCTLTGLDDGASFAIIYHIAKEDGTMLNLKTRVPRENPKVNTITTIFPHADIFERELTDLFGIIVEGLPEGKRYPLPDEWPKDEYPLRKDWKAQVKEG